MSEAATSKELLCRIREEVRDWQEALCGEREGLDELCAEIDAHLAHVGAVSAFAKSLGVD